MALLKKRSASRPSKKAEASETKPKRRLPLPGFIRSIGRYVKGSWQELRQTKWTTRKATWQLTVAVSIFTIALMLFIVGIDYLFDMLFQKLVL